MPGKTPYFSKQVPSSRNTKAKTRGEIPPQRSFAKTAYCKPFPCQFSKNPLYSMSFGGNEAWAPRNGRYRTVSGWEHSSTKVNLSCAVGYPGWSSRSFLFTAIFDSWFFLHAYSFRCSTIPRFSFLYSLMRYTCKAFSVVFRITSSSEIPFNSARQETT